MGCESVCDCKVDVVVCVGDYCACVAVALECGLGAVVGVYRVIVMWTLSMFVVGMVNVVLVRCGGCSDGCMLPDIFYGLCGTLRKPPLRCLPLPWLRSIVIVVSLVGMLLKW